MFSSDHADLSKEIYLLASPFYNFFHIHGGNSIISNEYPKPRIWPKVQLEFLNEFLNASCNDYMM